MGCRGLRVELDYQFRPRVARKIEIRFTITQHHVDYLQACYLAITGGVT